MKELFTNEWKNLSLMLLLMTVAVYFMVQGETELLVGTIVPMVAVGLNLESDKNK